MYDGLDTLIVDSQGLAVPQYYDDSRGSYAVETTDGSIVLGSDNDFKLETLLVDEKGLPIPQLWNPYTLSFEPKTNQSINDNNKKSAEIKKLVSRQKFDKSSVLEEFRVNGIIPNGEIIEYTGYVTSDFIEIEDGTNEIIISKSSITDNIFFDNIAYYNDKKFYIHGYNTGELFTNEYGRLSLTPPADAKYFRYSVRGDYQKLGIFLDEYSNNFNYYTEYPWERSQWYGKKVVAYGDKLAYGASNEVDNWLGMIAAKTGCEPVNRAISSSDHRSSSEKKAWVSDGVTHKYLGEYGEYVSRPTSLDDASGTKTSHSKPPGTVEIKTFLSSNARINTIPEDASAVIVLAGVDSEFSHSDIDAMLSKLTNRCPKAVILSFGLPFYMNNNNVADVKSLNNVISETCESYGYNYFDLRKKEGTNRLNIHQFVREFVYLNELGHKKRANYIYNILKDIEPLV